MARQLGIDDGTTCCKAAVFDEDGQELGLGAQACDPVRYTHAPIELLALDDLAGMVALCEHVLRPLPADPAALAPRW